MALSPDDVTALARSLGLPEDPPLGPPTLALTPQDPRLKPSTQALLQDPLLRALSDLDRVLAGPRPSTMGAATFDIECPWSNEHTDRATSGTVYVPLRTKFRCHHGHCENRTHEHLRLKVDELLREDSGGLVGLVHYEFDALDPGTLPDPPACVPPMELFFRDTIYVTSATRQKFWSIRSRVAMDDDALNQRWRVALSDVLPIDERSPKSNPRKLAPGQWYRVHPRKREADGYISWPGGRVLHVHHGRTLVNTWVAPEGQRSTDLAITDDQVRPWLILVHHVLGCATMDEAENLELALDWLAMVVGSWAKPGWHILITGPQGLGKDIIMVPLVNALGDMAEEITSRDLGGANNLWARARFLRVNEMKQTTRATSTPHDQMNALKEADNTRQTVWVAGKWVARHEARNVYCMWISSNEAMPLKLDPNDRRFMVFDRLLTPVNKPLIEDYLKWLDQEDPQLDDLKGWELVKAWLVQRWATMTDLRKRVLTGRAPMTLAKADMIEADVNEIEAWGSRGMDAAPPAPEAWPDIVWPLYVHERLIHAVKQGHEGLGPRTHVPSLDAIGRLLAKIGAVKLNGGNPIEIQGRRTRVWAVRNKELYELLNRAELQRIVGKMAPGSRITDFDA